MYFLRLVSNGKRTDVQQRLQTNFLFTTLLYYKFKNTTVHSNNSSLNQQKYISCSWRIELVVNNASKIDISFSYQCNVDRCKKLNYICNKFNLSRLFVRVTFGVTGQRKRYEEKSKPHLLGVKNVDVNKHF